MVGEMRHRGLKAVIITNGHAEIQRAKLEACRAAGLFDGVLVGGEEIAAGRAEKPHPSIFQAACRLAACEPHEVGCRYTRPRLPGAPAPRHASHVAGCIEGGPHRGQPGGRHCRRHQRRTESHGVGQSEREAAAA